MPNPEIMRFVEDYSKELGLLFLSLPVFAMAFSVWIRKLIGQRDNWTDQETGESFKDGYMVHASHYNHDRNNPDYDTVDNGRIQSVESHQRYHEDHRGRAKDIGLSERDNNWAIDKLAHTDRRTESYRQKNGG